MIEISKHKLLGSIHEIMLAVEDCGASPELTKVTTLLTKLMVYVDVMLDGSTDPATITLRELHE